MVETVIKAEILAIGDELCYGRVYDTNSFWLADQVTRLGVIVQRITCIRDDPDEISSVLKDVLSRKPRFVFITGGLGPTEDDRTIEALAKFAGRSVIVDKNILKTMIEGRKVSSSRLLPGHFKMSSTVIGAECLPSPVGWAPLTILRMDETTIFTMPGPPREMKSIFSTHVIKKIQDVAHSYSFARRLIVTMHESELAPLITQILKNVSKVYLKPLVSEYTVERGLVVEVIVFGDDEESCRSRYEQVLRMLQMLVEQKGRKIEEE